MNIKKLKGYWYPIALKKEIKTKPIHKKLLSIDIVLVKLKNKIYAYEDRCPHRNIALSDGFIKDDKLYCGYHGWSFSKDGKVDNIVGCKKCSVDIQIDSYAIKVIDDVIWLRLKGNKKFVDYFKPKNGFDSLLKFKSLKADFIHSIENFLDPTHTPFIHKNLLRTEGVQRMKVSQSSDDVGFCTVYDLIDKQNGLINKLLDNGIDKNIATFISPGFAKIEYFKQEQLLFEVAIFFVPIDKGMVDMVVKVSVKKGIVPSVLKFIILKPFLEIAFYQDKKILEKQYVKQKKLNKPYTIVKSDLVIDHLLYLLNDCKKGENKDIIMEL